MGRFRLSVELAALSVLSGTRVAAEGEDATGIADLASVVVVVIDVVDDDDDDDDDDDVDVDVDVVVDVLISNRMSRMSRSLTIVQGSSRNKPLRRKLIRRSFFATEDSSSRSRIDNSSITATIEYRISARHFNSLMFSIPRPAVSR